MKPRVLVVGMGNVLRGDDGFGPAVIQALEAGPALPEGVRAVEIGIGGVGLVHELMAGYDALLLVDAVDRRAAPGALFVLEPQVPDTSGLTGLECREMVADMHQTVPGPALIMARAVGALPPLVRLIGCQPGETDELSTELTPPVRLAVPCAVQAIAKLIYELADEGGPREPGEGNPGHVT